VIAQRNRIPRTDRLAGIALAILCFLVFASATGSAAAQDDLLDREQQAMRAALDTVAPSVIQIQTVGGKGATATQLGQQTSSALVLSEDGFLVSSAYNFISEPSAILATLPSGTTMPAKLIATDHNRGVALLKVDLPAGVEPLAVPEMAPLESIRVGAWALAVGRMYETKQPNVSVGIISALDRVWSKAIQTDAKISPSNYGGPLVDIHGRVIGLLGPLSPHAEMGMSGTDWYDSGIGFAVPLSDIRAIVPRLKEGKDLHRGLMGISLEGRDLFSVKPKIIGVHPRGPADEAGLKENDIIVKAAGVPVINQAQLKHAVGPLYAGDQLALTVLRKEKPVEITLELTDKLIPYEHPFLGILPRRDEASSEGEAAGVVVRYVYPNSPAADAGLEAGDRITKLGEEEVADAAALRQKLSRQIPEEKVTITRVRGDETQVIEITLAKLPTDLPRDLPAVEELAAFEGDRPKTGIFELKLAEFENECSVYVPENYHPAATYGVVIWLQAPGKFDGEALLARWKDHCDKRNLILLAPRPRDPRRWTADELEFVRRTYDEIEKDYSIDPNRIVAHGHEGGGAMAYYVAFSQRDVVRGVAAVQSPVPASARPPATDPANRLAIYTATSKENESAARIALQIKGLEKMKYPVTVVEFLGKPRYLGEAELADLVSWIDSLDRI